MKKYLPDFLILIGIWMFAYVSLFPIRENWNFGPPDYSDYYKLLAIIFISLGIDIVIRKFQTGK